MHGTLKSIRKDTNPKDAIGIRKTPFTTVSFAVIKEVGLGMLEGAMKYGRHNYRVAGVRASVYVDATFRHLCDWWEGEDIDKASMLSHVTKAIASLCVLRDSMIQGNWVDDRPPKSKQNNAALQAIVDELFIRYPNPKAAYTELDSIKKLLGKRYRKPSKGKRGKRG